ncbi:hypothetical protein [Nostoc sp.]
MILILMASPTSGEQLLFMKAGSSCSVSSFLGKEAQPNGRQ